MFIDPQDSVDVALHYKKIGKTYLCYNDGDFKKIPEEEAKAYKSLNVVMRVTDWGIYNDLQNKAIETDEEGNRRFNNKKYKELRLQTLIKDWDVKDANDKVVKPTPEKIRQIAPSIAEMILEEYDTGTFLSEEEEKN